MVRPGVAALLGALALAACAAPDLPAAAKPLGRATPEDSDLLAVVPAEAEVLVVLDVAALRASPWTKPLIAAGAAERGGHSRGFDEVADVDRLLLVRLPADTAGTSLSIAQGRFDRAHVRQALAGRPVTVADFRGCALWTVGTETTAFLTDRTLLTGALGSVRAAIDAAYGRARDLRGEAWLGEVRRRFGKDLPPPAIELAVRLSDPMRERLRDEMVEAEGLERLAARVELGKRLDLAVVGATGTGEQATALIERVRDTLRDLSTRLSLQALGFGPVLSQIQLAVKGPRVAAELRLREKDRDAIAHRLSAVARVLARARPAEAAPSPTP